MLLKQARPGAQRNQQINGLKNRLRRLEGREERLRMRMGFREIELARATESYQDSCLRPLRLRDLIVEPFRLQWIKAMEDGRRADLSKAVDLARKRDALGKRLELINPIGPGRKKPAFGKRLELAEGAMAH